MQHVVPVAAVHKVDAQVDVPQIVQIHAMHSILYALNVDYNVDWDF